MAGNDTLLVILEYDLLIAPREVVGHRVGPLQSHPALEHLIQGRLRKLDLDPGQI